MDHVTARGNARQDIVADDTDRARFDDVLGRIVGSRRWRGFARSLMDTPYRPIVEIPEQNLACGMRDLNQVVAQAFKRRHRRVDHVL